VLTGPCVIIIHVMVGACKMDLDMVTGAALRALTGGTLVRLPGAAWLLVPMLGFAACLCVVAAQA
jgi:hypothetical protein